MKQVKSKLTLLLAVVVLVSLLGGCGGNSSSGTSEPSGSTPPPAQSETPPAPELDYPKKDITVVVPYGAGGTTDLCVRGVLDAVPDGAVSKNFMVSNVAGGSGLVGATQFVNAAADGYTIGVLNCDLVLNNVLGNTEITSDQFVPLACIENDPYLFVVSKDAPYQTFEDFVAYAKDHPGEITVSDTGAGAAPHLAYLALTQQLGLDLKTIAYDSAADSVVGVVSGEVQAAITASGAAVGQIEGGNLVPLAVTSNERLSTYPDVPAMGELIPELENMQVNSWIMLAVRAETDSAIISFLQEAFAPAAVSDAYRATQEGFFFQPVSEMSNGDMLDFVASQHDYYVSLLG